MWDPARLRAIAPSKNETEQSASEPWRGIALESGQSCKSAWLNDDAKVKSTCRASVDLPGAMTFPMWKGGERSGPNNLAGGT